MRVTFAVAAADGGASCGRRWSVEMDVQRTDTERQLFAAIADRLGTPAVGLSLRYDYPTEEGSRLANLPHPPPQDEEDTSFIEGLRCMREIPEEPLSDELWDVLLQLHAFSDVCGDNLKTTHTLRFIERQVSECLLVVRVLPTAVTSAIGQVYGAHGMDRRDVAEDRVFDAFCTLAPPMQHDRDVVLAALGCRFGDFCLFDEESSASQGGALAGESAVYRHDIEFAKRSISCTDMSFTPRILQMVEWRDTKEVMLHYLREVQRENRRRLAKGRCGLTHQTFRQTIQTHLWADIDIVTRALEIDGMSLTFVWPPLKDREDVVRIALAQCGLALKYASLRLRDSHDMVAAALSTNGEAIQHAAERWRDDDLCALQAVTQNGKAYVHLSERLRSHGMLLTLAMQQYPSVLAVAPDTFTSDRLFMLGACTAKYTVEFGIKYGWCGSNSDPDKECHALQYASPILQDDDNVVRASVSAHGNSLRFASERLRDDVEIVHAAMAHTPRAYRFASANIRERCLTTALLFAQSCANVCNVFEQLPQIWRNSNYAGAAAIVAKTVIAHTHGVPDISGFGESLLANRDIVKFAFARNRANRTSVTFYLSRPVLTTMTPLLLAYVDPVLLEDMEFVNELVAENETNPKCDFSELLTCTSAQSTALRNLTDSPESPNESRVHHAGPSQMRLPAWRASALSGRPGNRLGVCDTPPQPPQRPGKGCEAQTPRRLRRWRVAA